MSTSFLPPIYLLPTHLCFLPFHHVLSLRPHRLLHPWAASLALCGKASLRFVWGSQSQRWDEGHRGRVTQWVDCHQCTGAEKKFMSELCRIIRSNKRFGPRYALTCWKTKFRKLKNWKIYEELMNWRKQCLKDRATMVFTLFLII